MSTDTRQFCDEDEEVISSPYSNHTSSSVELPDSSSNLWSLPVQSDRWTNLAHCMQFVALHRMRQKPVLLWMRRTLNRLSRSLKPKQLRHLMNGYADLYKIIIYVINAEDNVPISPSHVFSYSGTSSKAKKEKRCRDVAYIMHKPSRSSFSPFCAVSTTGGFLKTTFKTNDMASFNHVRCLINEINDNISRRATLDLEHAIENHDATVNGQEVEDSDSLDIFLSSPSAKRSASGLSAENERDVATLQLSNEVLQRRNSLTEMDLDHSQRMPESVPMETEECRATPDGNSGGENLISRGVIIKAKQRRRRRKNAQRNTTISVPLSGTTEDATPLIEPQSKATINLPQECDSFKIKVHPKRYRHVRMLMDLAANDCPLVQGSDQKQRAYPEIELKALSDQADHIRIRAVTETGYPHPWQCVTPTDPLINLQMESTHGERKYLQCDPDKFNPEYECVYSAIDVDERQTRKKLIQVHLIKWKHARANIEGGAEEENPRRCSLEVYLCKRLGPGEFELLSEPCYTTIIELGDGDLSIDPNQVEPKELRATGGETISFPLSVRCLKKNFLIQLNGRKLDLKSFAIEKKKLIITYPPKPNHDDKLHVTIKQMQFVGASSQSTAKILYDGHLKYASHD